MPELVGTETTAGDSRRPPPSPAHEPPKTGTAASSPPRDQALPADPRTAVTALVGRSVKLGLCSQPDTPPSKPPRIQPVTGTVSQPSADAFSSSTVTVPLPLALTFVAVTTEV